MTGTATDPGRRLINEDRVYVDAEAGVFLVVDGLGGHAAGERAAQTAVEVIARELRSHNGSPEQRIRHSIAAANNEIYRLSQQEPECNGMGCVLTLAVLGEHTVTVGHVGDSRMYLIWNGAVRKLTSDHSPVGEREDQGEVTEAQAMLDPRRNEIFRDVGSQPHDPDDKDFVEVKALPFQSSAALLMCTDGLSDALASADIAAIVETYDGDPDRVARALVNEAKARGSADNVSVIFVPGPEFNGAQARGRHAITRMRRGRRPWRRAAGRLFWVAIGIVIGVLLWSVAQRFAV
ncbi:MAG TPA: protein phosphatase 2C domain-containing protein [Bryobacteraceae bacterium]|nr:protein phosphatase 2C domain-containing protein [Bryobacteraceae bacterium]